MGLKLRYYESGLIRSEGDAPNGLLGVSVMGEEATLIVHPSVQPPKAEGGGIHVAQYTDDPFEQGATAITASEAIDACADADTVGAIWTMVLAQVGHYTERTYETFVAENIAKAAALVIEVRDAMNEHDYISRRPRTEAGRNEPCPCGSGKKYKRCCGE